LEKASKIIKSPPHPHSYLAWLKRRDISGNGNVYLSGGRKNSCGDQNNALQLQKHRLRY